MSVKDLEKRIAEAEGAKASAALRAQLAEEAEKKALLWNTSSSRRACRTTR